MDVIRDWTFILLLLLLVYGVYAPCMLALLDPQVSHRQRLKNLCCCLFLSWFGYWLSQRDQQHPPLKNSPLNSQIH